MTVLTQQQPAQQWPMPHAAQHAPQPPSSPPAQSQPTAAAASGVVFEFKNTDPSSMATAPTVTAASGPSIGPTVCSNCKTTDTPLWRRDADGNSICNACGLYQKSRRMARPTALQRSPSSAPSTATTAVEPTPAPAHLGGTCPGDGRCDGTGGTSACSGCPTFNNALQAHAQHQQQQHNSPSPHPSSPSPPPATIANDEAKAPNANNQRGRVPISSLSCHNCNTSTTPLWRRDDAGNNICNACGLYLKLHGTHRPNSMKKSIIKRRKRVPAAAGGATSSPSAVTRAAEHAAAETLLAVGRAASLSSRSGSAAGSGASDNGSASEGDAGRRKRKRGKDDDGHGEAPRMTRRASAAAVAARSLLDVSSSGAPSPSHPRMQSLHPLQTHARHSPSYDSLTGRYHGSASPAGGYDLPSIAALSAGMSPRESEAAAMLAERSLSRERLSHMSRVPSMGSDAHSNSAPSSMSQHSGIPTYGELERHYAELRAEKRRLEEMVERTSSMMDRVRVGMEDLARGQQQQQQQQQQQSAPAASSVEHSPHMAQAVPLRAREAPRTSQPVWQWSGQSSSNDQDAKP